MLRHLLLLIGLLSIAPILAQAETGGLNCRAEGYDVILHNAGERALPAGTALDWSLPLARIGGRHVLDRDLPPDRVTVLSGATRATYLTKPTPCTVTLHD
ncbi:hypothetical protein [Rhodovulum strictum]|uniref:Uncharacterized protein n=1 Tax=Rhodovulum strictum TaxID=58314 RepID=A0A844BK12_9RHOB|nr:hypothetical protein [Rhodovulum strictum]MRH21352.1 hypothetical protein [Rhodovulum strictum]